MSRPYVGVTNTAISFNSVDEFLSGLVDVPEDVCDGMKIYFDGTDKVNAYGSIFVQKGTIDSLLIVFDHMEYTTCIGTEISMMNGTDSACMVAEVFANQANILCNTESDIEFSKVAKQSLANGMFLSLQELEEKQKKYTLDGITNKNDDDCTFFAAIVTQNFSKDEIDIDIAIDRKENGVQTVTLTTNTCQNNCVQTDSNSPTFDVRQNAQYKGYVTNETETSVTCNIPLIFAMDGYDEESYTDLFFYGNYRRELISLTSLWSRCQNNLSTPEGIAVSDGLVPASLRQKLMNQIDAFAYNTEADYHPHSKGIVRDLVHPALYSYVEEISITDSLEEVPPVTFPQIVDWGPPYPMWNADFDPSTEVDYWGRAYEASAKYQWLPTYFDIAADGSCSIADYINNLVPRADHEHLYESLSELFSQALPLIESVFSYGRSVRPRMRTMSLEEGEDNDCPDRMPLKVAHHTLRGEKLQVITKIVDYELKPGQTYEGVWHVEGMSHEEIVATAIYFIHRDDDIKGGDILFKRAYHRDEARFVHENVFQTRPPPLDDMIWKGLLPLGTVQTLSNRLLVFPNSHVHKVTKLENAKNTSNESLDIDANDTDSIQKRRIIVFFLVNPEKRIISTREVPPQQTHVGGTMSREDAMKHRLELMKERKFSKQDWNIREIELCEH